MIQPELSVIIPFYNEAANIERTLRVLRETLNDAVETFELVLIDDGSSDKTWPLLKTYAAEFEDTKALRFSRNFGKEAALFAGIQTARGRAAIIMDGDLQHPPEIIPEMLSLWRDQGYQVVEGIKETRGQESIANRIGSKFFYRILHLVSGLDLKNASDFKLLDRKVLDALAELGEVNLFFRGLSEWVGFRRCKVYFKTADRTQGQSRWSLRALFRLAITGITSFSALPLYIISILGVFFLGMSALGIVHTLYQKFAGNAVSGFATVIILQLLIGSFIMIGLGIIGVYLAKVYDEVKKRPQYIVQERTEQDHD
jgi:dolichol-phosphate mannosyltransferase